MASFFSKVSLFPVFYYAWLRSHSIQEEEIPFVSPGLLTRLPGLQYFAFLAGSTLYKGRGPLLVDD